MSENKILLLIPYELKDELKKTEKIFWNTDKKLWCCNKLTKGLKDYDLKFVDIDYTEKDEWKLKLKSMKWIQ